ncbi:hypothetical protein [Spirosoma aerophilum]
MRYALLAFVLLVFAACSKKTDVHPHDPVAQVAGTYKMTALRYDSANVSIYNLTLPMTGPLTGKMVVRRDSATVISTTYTVKQPGSADIYDTFGQLTLKGITSPYDIYYGDNKIGSTDGKTFTIDYAYTDNGVLYREVYTGVKVVGKSVSQ